MFILRGQVCAHVRESGEGARTPPSQCETRTTAILPVRKAVLDEHACPQAILRSFVLFGLIARPKYAL